MSFQLFIAAMRARYGVVLLVLCGAVAAAAGVSLYLPKIYSATVSLVVDAKDEQSLGNVLRPLTAPQERVSYLQTQIDIITSEKVARKVVRALDLARRPDLRRRVQAAEGSDAAVENALVRNLIDNTKVDSSQSSVIRVGYSSTDPQLSADVANGIARAYIDTMLELRVEPTREAAAWFDEQLKSLRANLEDAQARLTEYYRRHGIVSATEHDDVENARLQTLSDAVSKAQTDAAEWAARARQAREYLARGGSAEGLPEVLDNPLVQKLKAELVQGEAHLQELLSQYGENHPRYRQQLSENRSLRARLDDELATIVTGIENAARLSSRREAQARQAMAAQRAVVLDQKEGRNELTVLRRNVESAERAYDTAMQRYVVNRVESRANQTNVSLLNPAVAPLRPVRPKVVLNVALAAVAGTLIGIGLVMLLELSDRRVRLRSDLALDVPLLAVLNAWQPPRASLPGRSATRGARLPNAH